MNEQQLATARAALTSFQRWFSDDELKAFEAVIDQAVAATPPPPTPPGAPIHGPAEFANLLQAIGENPPPRGGAAMELLIHRLVLANEQLVAWLSGVDVIPASAANSDVEPGPGDWEVGADFAKDGEDSRTTAIQWGGSGGAGPKIGPESDSKNNLEQIMAELRENPPEWGDKDNPFPVGFCPECGAPSFPDDIMDNMFKCPCGVRGSVNLLEPKRINP